MSVKLRKWTKKDGSVVEAFIVSFTFRHPDGRVTRVREASPVQTRRGAEQYEAQIRLELKNGVRDAPKSAAAAKVNVPTVAEFETEYLELYCGANREKPSSIEAKKSVFRNYLVPWLGNKKLDAIKDVDVQRVKANMQHLAPKTVNNTLTVLSTVLKSAAKKYGFSDLPEVKLLKVAPPKMDFYEQADYERLVTEAGKLDRRYRLMVLLGGDAGLRSGEILGVEYQDVDFVRGVLHVERAVWQGKVGLPKGGRSRKVNLTARLLEALREGKAQGGRILRRDNGGPVTREVVCGWMKKAQAAAGLDARGNLHVLRHTFCSRLAMEGAPALAIKELAGHVSIKTTERYMHLSPAAKGSAIALLDKAAERNAATAQQPVEARQQAG